jgi:hypothetical protein
VEEAAAVFRRAVVVASVDLAVVRIKKHHIGREKDKS